MTRGITKVFRRLRAAAAKRYTIVMADRSSGAVRRFTLPLWPAAAATTGLVALPVLMTLGARWSVRAEVDQLRAANASLQLQNDSYREATGQLAGQIAVLQSAVDDIGSRAAVDPAATRAMEKLPPVVKSRAMGGVSAAEALVPMLGGGLGSPETALGVLRDVLLAIESRLDSVRSGVERRQALASATPSIWPVAGWLSSSYGTRRDPFNGGSDFHPGLDISAPAGQPVLATADGVVVSASPNGAYGNLVVIEHGFGITTRYGHLSRFAVKAGEHIDRGDVVGFVGSTGRSTSPHLHYEIWMNGRLTNPMRLLARP